ncbi:hypothetical protein [Hymenobacter terricola]|uniref:hypothetical protein n=1 Tax=Hymenobacter terricola TaxID=2819236 RepID=UPI001B307358|nr:hypothetical protein [Hymenobacter terricola]
MKTLYPLLLVALFAACQHSEPATTGAPVAAAPLAVPTSADSLSPTTLAMLRQYDLAPLWANRTDGKAAQSAMEGFYGDTPYRISFYFSRVERDPAQPNLFHVTGLDRYKKVITPFTGTITVRDIVPFTDSMYVDAPDSTARAFTAVSRFVLREDPATRGAGSYAGEALLDFYYDAHHHLDQASALDEDANPTKGSGLLFRGSQVSNKTGHRQPMAFANFYGAVVPQALSKLGLGDRSEEVNPNLARFGWNEAWENDEWWAKSPKPSLSL